MKKTKVMELDKFQKRKKRSISFGRAVYCLSMAALLSFAFYQPVFAATDTVDVLYNLLCRNESARKPLPVKVKEVMAKYVAAGREAELDEIPTGEFYAPESVDFMHGSYIEIDGSFSETGACEQ